MAEKYQILIEAKPSSTPGIVRMRRLLKALLRMYGLRCVECRKVQDEQDDDQ